MTDTTEIPAEINPQSTPEQRRARVGLEQNVNAQVAHFLNEHREAITETFLAGGTVELVHDRPDVDDDSHPGEEIAPETALALAADEGLKPYADWTKDELKDEAGKRKLATSGSKDDLIERLEASDADDATTPVAKS